MERTASEDGKNIARGYRLDSQSIFSQLSQPLFTAPLKMLIAGRNAVLRG
jgi:hypothetical protein